MCMQLLECFDNSYHYLTSGAHDVVVLGYLFNGSDSFSDIVLEKRDSIT